MSAGQEMQAQGDTSADRATAAQRLADGGWHRMHPLTPVVRSWRILVVALIFAGQSQGDVLLSGNWLRELGTSSASGRVALIALGAVVTGVGLAGGLAYGWWRASRFRIGEESLELYQGILFRQHRSARLDRVQTIEVAQPFVARLAGLARLTLEVAGGGDSKVQLEYLTEADAQSLRNHLLARAAGVEYGAGEEAPEAPEHPVAEVPVPRLLLSLLLSGPVIVMSVCLVGLVIAAVLDHSPRSIAAALPAMLGAAGLVWGRFNGGFNFRIGTSPDGLRVRYGLLEHRAQTVPPGRVQAVRLRQPLLWRWPDWWAVEVNIAGVQAGGQQEQATGSHLLPVGSREEAIRVLALVLPDLGVAAPYDPWQVVQAGLTGSSPADGYLVAPARARWVDPIGWRRTGVWVTAQALLIRRGRIWRQLDVVPHARTQSLGLAQGPLQRRMRVASFVLHSTPGPVQPVVAHLDEVDAARLLADQALRAEGARGASGPERWMQAPG
jgi:putative membrane protein